MNDANREGHETVRTGFRHLSLRVWTPVAAVAVFAVLLFGTGGAGACYTPSNPTPNVLATIPLVATVAANSTMVFAQGVTNCTDIWGITPSDNVSVYTTVPITKDVCQEGALTLAPISICPSTGPGNGSLSPRVVEWGSHGGGGKGSSGCQKNPCYRGYSTGQILYDVIDGVLYEITQGGSNVTKIASFTVPSTTSENMGLTWDQVGTFGHDLIVTSSSQGKVWLVNQTGNVTLLAELHTYISGPTVAPWGFGSYGGDLLVAAKHLGEVVAINATGSTSIVANWTTPNAVSFESTGGSGGGPVQSAGSSGGCGYGGRGCSFGPDHDVMFVTNYSSGAVEGFPASDFYYDSSQGFIAGGLNSGIGTFTSSGSTSYFATETQRLSDLSFITCYTNQCGGHGHGGW